MNVTGALNATHALALAEAGEDVLALHTPTDNAARPCDCNRRNCANIGKHPRTRHGKDDATSDLNIVACWWDRWPQANVGRRPAPGEIVLDVDPRNGGHIQLKAIEDRFGELPATRTVVTGSGGLHICYRYDGPVRGQLAPGIDLKSRRGYVVAPPSLHASGGRYTYAADSIDTVTPLPRFLVPYVQRRVVIREEIGSRGATPGREAALVRVVAQAEDGNLNNKLFWACCRAVEHGIDINPLIDAAIEKGHPRGGAEKTAQSAINTAYTEEESA